LYQHVYINSRSFTQYLYTVGENFTDYPYNEGYKYSIIICSSIKEVMSKFVALCNTCVVNQNAANKLSRKDIMNMFITILDDIKIPYELYEDGDGYFIFPKGAKELDDSLISEPMQWLSDYPLARTAFATAMKEYAESKIDTASEVADLLRKALERFFQEFFNVKKSLENCKSMYGDYLKNKGIPAEISGNFQTLLQAYTNFNNNYAKHHDKASLNCLEYIMYETGNIIRLLITLSKN
ncbi:MAG: hypothetical protein K2N23_00030, partial [Clostridia bacterium]|nr:hypothetical protein [Clostridia bacterium]